MAAEGAMPRPAQGKNLTERLLDGIERLGNKVPHPAIIFVALCAIVIVLSQVLYWLNVSVTYEVAVEPPVAGDEVDLTGSDFPEVVLFDDYAEPEFDIEERTTEVEGLLTVEGVRFLFTTFISNFAGFSVVAVTFVAMMGVGVAEGAGLMAALIRKLVQTAPRGLLTFIIVFVGVLSSIATDAGYLILIPLGAIAFLSVGRHPLAGLAAAYAGVSVSFAVNVLITPLDSLLTEVTNEAIAIVDSSQTIGITSNLYFAIASSVFTAVVVTIVTHRLIEPRLGTYHGQPAEPEAEGSSPQSPAEPGDPEAAAAAESRGLRYALFGLVGFVIFIVLMTAPSGAPLRNPETGGIVGDSPFMDSLVFLISLVFLVTGIAYGKGAGTFTSSVDIINSVTKTFAGLAGLIFLLLIISQFIAYFNYSNMPAVAAVTMADGLEQMDVGAIWLLIGMILVIAVLDIIMTGALPKWAIFAPVFIPLFMRLDVAPQTVLAAYRVGDSPMNVITPMMVYLPFIVFTAQRYEKTAGLGTIISLMIPYTIVILVTWVLFFAVWFLLGIPLGPGYPVDAS
ncbi:MAG TPA: AbgT family transporter [Dehalococcoidia bacterium]|nr:AbgT family transporter [Dehalococcoidia bacterium]